MEKVIFEQQCQRLIKNCSVSELRNYLRANLNQAEIPSLQTESSEWFDSLLKLAQSILSMRELADDSGRKEVYTNCLEIIFQELPALVAIKGELFQRFYTTALLADSTFVLNSLEFLEGKKNQTQFLKDYFMQVFKLDDYPRLANLIRYCLHNNKTALRSILKSQCDLYTWVGLLRSSDSIRSFSTDEITQLLQEMVVSRFKHLYLFDEMIGLLSDVERETLFTTPILKGMRFLDIAIRTKQYHLIQYLMLSGHYQNQWAYLKNSEGTSSLQSALKDPRAFGFLIHMGGLDIESCEGITERHRNYLKWFRKSEIRFIHKTKKRALCLKGGGMKGAAYPSAIDEAQRMGLISLDEIEACTGTSAGGITSFLLTIGASSEELSQVILEEIDYVRLLEVHEDVNKASYIKILNDDSEKLGLFQKGVKIVSNLLKDSHGIVRSGGIFKMHKVRDFFVEKLNEKLEGTEYKDQAVTLTYSQYARLMKQYPSRFKRLRVVGWCSELAEAVFFGPEERYSEDVNVIQSILTTMAIPGVFEAQTFIYRGRLHTFVDGGVGFNFPFEYAAKGFKKDELLGFYFSEDSHKDKIIAAAKERAQSDKSHKSTLAAFFNDLVHVTTSGLETQNAWHLKNQKEYLQTIHINTHDISPTSFQLSDSDKNKLIKYGREGVQDYVSKSLAYTVAPLSQRLKLYIYEISRKFSASMDGFTFKLELAIDFTPSAKQLYQLYRRANATDLPYLRILFNPNHVSDKELTALDYALHAEDKITHDKLLASGANVNRTQKSVKSRASLIVETKKAPQKNHRAMRRVKLKSMKMHNHQLEDQLHKKDLSIAELERERAALYARVHAYGILPHSSSERVRSRRQSIAGRHRLVSAGRTRMALGFVAIGVGLAIATLLTLSIFMFFSIKFSIIPLVYTAFFLVSSALCTGLGISLHFRGNSPASAVVSKVSDPSESQDNVVFEASNSVTLIKQSAEPKIGKPLSDSNDDALGNTTELIEAASIKP